MEYLNIEDIKHNLAIIKVNKSYYEGISSKELYEFTRSRWKRKLDSVQGIDYCLSVYNGNVIEVYKVDGWYIAGTYPMETRDVQKDEGRVEFVGSVAEEKIRNYYLNKSVKKLYKSGEASPIKTFFCKMDINKAYKPKKIIEENSQMKIVCPNCDYTFIKSKRCPECGQLIDYE